MSSITDHFSSGNTRRSWPFSSFADRITSPVLICGSISLPTVVYLYIELKRHTTHNTGKSKTLSGIHNKMINNMWRRKNENTIFLGGLTAYPKTENWPSSKDKPPKPAWRNKDVAILLHWEGKRNKWHLWNVNMLYRMLNNSW